MINHPISLRFIDTPGSLSYLKKSSLYSFRKVDLIFIVIDASVKLVPEVIQEWTLFIMS